jgi:hypothetical protein
LAGDDGDETLIIHVLCDKVFPAAIELLADEKRIVTTSAKKRRNMIARSHFIQSLVSLDLDRRKRLNRAINFLVQ